MATAKQASQITIEDLTLSISDEIHVRASIDKTFEALLEQLGPGNEVPEKGPMPMKLEAWPGGRWFRDLGNNTGHFWAHVQVIKPPKLLELCGPMFMSYPAAGHVSYRLKTDGKATVMPPTHKAFGLIPEDHIKGVREGWTFIMEKIARAAESKKR